ncbi:hypothetical protein Q3G72_010391 [Acer saccharum]|nr:hypothetical protein Q3G72_010391 [Acer saccharum]
MKKKIIVLSSVRALDSSLGSASTIESCDMQSAVQFDSGINNSATLEISTVPRTFEWSGNNPLPPDWLIMADLTGDTSGLGLFELEALQDCEYKFMSKYVKVGSIKKEEVPVADSESAAEENEGKCSYSV